MALPRDIGAGADDQVSSRGAFLYDPNVRQHGTCQVRLSTHLRNGGGAADEEGAAKVESAATSGESGRAVRRRARLADEVYDTLLAQLMSLRIAPGSRVTIDALARELDVSQTPIRDALNRMEADGLVVRVHLAGYRIPPQITRAQFEDIVEVRLLLEPTCARKAAENASPAQVSSLRDLLQEMARPADDSDHLAYGAFGRRDAAFHDLIALGGGNLLAREALARLHTHVHLFRVHHDTQVTYAAMGEHADIHEAIAARDPDGAAYAMRRHILQSAERFSRLFDAADAGEPGGDGARPGGNES